MIRDFDIGQIWDMLKDLNKDRFYDIRESRHVIVSFSKRSDSLNSDMVYDALFNKKPVSISKTSYDTFKVIYEHPTRISEDIYIIIQIDDGENILIVTVYTHSNDRRIRHHDR